MRKQPKPLGSKTFALWMLVLVISLIAVKYVGEEKQLEEKISYSEFVNAVKDGHVSEVTIQGENVIGTIRGKFNDEYKGNKTKSSFFRLTGNTGEQTYNILTQHKIIPNYEQEPEPSFIKSLLTWLETVVPV